MNKQTNKYKIQRLLKVYQPWLFAYLHNNINGGVMGECRYLMYGIARYLIAKREWNEPYLTLYSVRQNPCQNEIDVAVNLLIIIVVAVVVVVVVYTVIP